MPQYIRQSYLSINYSQRERNKTRPSTTIEKLGHSFFWTLLYKMSCVCQQILRRIGLPKRTKKDTKATAE